MSQKGGKYERDFCRLLSLWWTGGNDEDCYFWRTYGSGGRAKRRGRGGKRTHGQHGDVCATHPEGDALTKCLTIELKRGYSKFTFADVLDKPERFAQQEWSAWLEQTLESHSQAGSLSWLLVQRRDQRDAVAFIPSGLFDSLRSLGCFSTLPCPFATLYFREGKTKHKVCCMRLDEFFEQVDPQDIRRLVRNDLRS